MAYVGMVCNPAPEWPWPDEKPQPMRSRYLSGLYPLEEFAPLLRPLAGLGGMDQADRWFGLTDGGNGLVERLRENFARVEVVILDFFHPAERLTGLARRLHPEDQTKAEEQAHQWRVLLKEEGGAVLGAVLSEWDRPKRSGLSDAADELVGYLERHAQRSRACQASTISFGGFMRVAPCGSFPSVFTLPPGSATTHAPDCALSHGSRMAHTDLVTFY